MQFFRHHGMQPIHDHCGSVPTTRTQNLLACGIRERDQEECQDQTKHDPLGQTKNRAKMAVVFLEFRFFDPVMQDSSDGERHQRKRHVEHEHRDPAVERLFDRDVRSDLGRQLLGKHEAGQECSNRCQLPHNALHCTTNGTEQQYRQNE